MHGLTDYITDQPWVDTFTAWYVWVDEAYQAVVAQTGRLRTRGPVPTFSDSEVITVALIAETIFHGHEDLCLALFKAERPKTTRRRGPADHASAGW